MKRITSLALSAALLASLSTPVLAAPAISVDAVSYTHLFFELLHQPASAVAAAHGVGTAAREAQIPQTVGPDVRGPKKSYSFLLHRP